MKIIVDGTEVDLKVGCDPEVFVSKRGQLVSGHGMVPGYKDSPHKTSKGAIQVDGMALEFNIDPANSEQEFFENVQATMNDLLSALPQGHKIEIQSTANFGKALIESQPEEAKELGCSPDYNAYLDGGVNPKPDADLPFRTAAGHIHIGWTDGANISDPGHIELCCKVTKLMDLFLGVPSVLLDTDTQRRSMYGQAGSFRAKSYGVEYRVLSNFWLKSPDMIKWAYKQTAQVIREFLSGTSGDQHQLERIINNSDKKAAQNLVTEMGIRLPARA